jgi:hypothetical protein
LTAPASERLRVLLAVLEAPDPWPDDLAPALQDAWMERVGADGVRARTLTSILHGGRVDPVEVRTARAEFERVGSRFASDGLAEAYRLLTQP